MQKIVFNSYVDSWSIENLSWQLDEIGDETPIEIEINSLGGSVVAGLKAYRMLKNRKGYTKASIHGLTASAATLIAMGADEVEMSELALIMVHDASVSIQEWKSMNAEQIDEYIAKLEKERDLVSKISNVLASVYMAKCGRDRDEVRGLMKTEKWLTATEAQEFGLIDTVAELEGATAATAFASKIQASAEAMRVQAAERMRVEAQKQTQKAEPKANLETSAATKPAKTEHTMNWMEKIKAFFTGQGIANPDATATAFATDFNASIETAISAQAEKLIEKQVGDADAIKNALEAQANALDTKVAAIEAKYEERITALENTLLEVAKNAKNIKDEAEAKVTAMEAQIKELAAAKVTATSTEPTNGAPILVSEQGGKANDLIERMYAEGILIRPN